MAFLTRAAGTTLAGLAAAFALPAVGQIPCDNSSSINCEFHPDHGWIIRGSAPGKEGSSESQLDKDLEKWREEAKDPEYRRKVEEGRGEMERRRAEAGLERRTKAAREILRKAAWTGTCPPEWTEQARGDPKLSYQLTLDACRGGDMLRCHTLQTVCEGDSMEPYKGTCRFSRTFSAAYDLPNAQWSDEVVRENRALLEKTCLADRQGWACFDQAVGYTFLRAPHGAPSKAYAYMQRACQLEGPKSMECDVLLDDCVPGGPPLALPSPQPQPASPAPAQRSKGFIVEPLRAAPLADAPPPPDSRLNEKPRPCTYPSVKQDLRDRMNARPAEEKSRRLRDAEQRCLADSDRVSCSVAAADNVMLAIPEAKPEKAWDLLTRACKVDSRACNTRATACPDS